MAISGRKISMWYGATLICEYPNQASTLGEFPMKLVDLKTSSDKDVIGIGITGLKVRDALFTIREIPFIYISSASKFNAKIRGSPDNTKASKLRFIPYNLLGVEQTQDIIEIELTPSELANASKDIEIKLNKAFDYKVVVEYKESNDYYILSTDPVGLQANMYFIHDWSLS